MKSIKLRISKVISRKVLVFKNIQLKLVICFFTVVISLPLLGQQSMTGKEGFFYLIKIDQAGVTDNAFNNNGSMRWFDLYVNLFDKSNYEFYKKDEFKWPAYSKKIVDEINQGKANADFSKLYSYYSTPTFGKYNFELGGFPLTDVFTPGALAIDDHITLQYKLDIGSHLNAKEISLILKMDPTKGEKLVESNPGRTLNAKVVYSVVNRMMTNLNKWNEKYMGIYVHKIVLLNGSTPIGEIKPSIDYVDKINLKKSNDENPTVTDIDGNIYHTVKIGQQVWMVENLKTTKFNDGTPISLVIDNESWKMQKNPSYCWYRNDSTYKNPYGALYNWHTVNKGNLAPEGWHVPSDEEWSTLIKYLGGLNNAGYKLKEVGIAHWKNPNAGVTNESGFTAVPGGSRSTEIGNFDNDLNDFGYYWTTTKFNEYSYSYRIGYQNQIFRSLDKHAGGLSVRCIQGAPIQSDVNSTQDTSQIANEKTQNLTHAAGITPPEKNNASINSENKKVETVRKKYEDGSFYEGEWKNNKRNGYGICKYSNGILYKGYWKNDKRDSVGVAIYPHTTDAIKETKFVGTYKDDKPFNGVMTSINWKDVKRELIIKDGVVGKWEKVRDK